MIAVIPEKEVVISHLAQSIERPPEQMVKLWEFVALVMEAHAGLPSAQNSCFRTGRSRDQHQVLFKAVSRDDEFLSDALWRPKCVFEGMR